MGWFSFTNIVSGLFILYICNSIWTVSQLFQIPSCTETSHTSGKSKDTTPNCIPPWAHVKDSNKMQLAVYTSTSKDVGSELRPKALAYRNITFDPQAAFTSDVNITLPKSVINNGTLFMHMVLLKQSADLTTSIPVNSDSILYITSAPFTQHQLPKLEAFNLMGAVNSNSTSSNPTSTASKQVPVTHLRSRVTLSVMADNVTLTRTAIPNELYQYLKLSRGEWSYLPIAYIDEISFRQRDLEIVTPDKKVMAVTIVYQPISAGKLRLWSQIQISFNQLRGLGFGDKEVDEVKGIFADTNFYFLMLTFFVSAVHILFDVLAFKNDVKFWRNKKNMVGLSSRVVIWRCVSTIIIFFYLMDQETSLLVLVPTGISAVIEVWKLTKAFKISIGRNGITFGESTEQERVTEEFDAVAMSYLSYLLYPLVIAGAVYSLIYTPHKSWYSWCLQSLVNGVYAFGFLFMLPQLFVNYKLKSVAHLPWKAFMYKAFNTFIDDIFAFIITMPTSHRLACFRDDIVFLIYLYQRWLYPVDKTRVNEYGQSFTEADGDKAKTD